MVKMSTASLMKQKTTDVKGRKGRKGLDDDDVIPEIVPGLMGADPLCRQDDQTAHAARKWIHVPE